MRDADKKCDKNSGAASLQQGRIVDLASIAFRFVEDMKQEALNTLNNACTKRVQKKFFPSLCPPLNFAAHTYSASLIQAQLPKMIHQFDIIVAGVDGYVGKPSFLPNAPSLTQDTALETVRTVLDIINSDRKSRDYPHMFRTNHDIKMEWFGAGGSKNKTSNTQQSASTSNDNEHKAMSVLLALETIKQAFQVESVQDLTDGERKSLAQAKWCISQWRHKMNQMLGVINEVHSVTYDTNLTSDEIDISSDKLMDDFHRRMWKIASDTRVWSKNILPQSA